MPPQAILEYQSHDYEAPLYSIEDIRAVLPQRLEMEQLTGIVWVDAASHSLIGFKDVTHQEFWVKGHMPGFPLMPGVLQCEAAAQLASFYAVKHKLLEGGGFVGFAGMDEVRFRGPVYPGSRLILCARATRVRPRVRAEFEFQGFVDDKLVFHGNMVGVPISSG